MKNFYKQIIKIVRDNWKDPVWSKVISAVIISSSSFIIGLVYFAIKSLIDSNSLINGLISFWKFLDTNTNLKLKNYTIGIVAILILSLLVPLIRFVKSKKKFIQKSEVKEEDIIPEKLESDQPKIYDKSTVFFDERMAEAFPGQRGLRWYKDAEIATERLLILLRNPLRFHPDSSEMSDPIWWFRGTSNLSISSCTKLSKNKILIDRYEYVIKEISAFRGDSYEKDFIYVRVNGEKPVGVYEWLFEDIERDKKQHGFCREEFGLFDGKTAISREEYDDGAAVINGKVIDTRGAKLRVRYLTDYNFIIAAKQSPINSHEFDKGSKEILNGILKGTHTFTQLIDFITPLNNPMC